MEIATLITPKVRAHAVTRSEAQDFKLPGGLDTLVGRARGTDGVGCRVCNFLEGDSQLAGGWRRLQ